MSKDSATCPSLGFYYYNYFNKKHLWRLPKMLSLSCFFFAELPTLTNNVFPDANLTDLSPLSNSYKRPAIMAGNLSVFYL